MKNVCTVSLILFVSFTVLFPASHYSVQTPPCSQSNRDRESLMRQAEARKFTVRRVEFIGLTYTRDETVRRRLVKYQQEGDLFSRAKLIQSLRDINKLRTEIYPARMKDVEVRLNESEGTIDLSICFKPKRR